MTKKLLRIVNNLPGKKNENPLPPPTNNRQLAKEFIEFFLNKIEKKGNDLKTYSHTNLEI